MSRRSLLKEKACFNLLESDSVLRTTTRATDAVAYIAFVVVIEFCSVFAKKF